MASLPDVLCVVMAVVTVGSCEVVIPDSVSYSAKNLVYYSKKSTWYQAGRQCQSRGGQLILVDSPQVASQLQKLTAAVGRLSSFYTGMVRHDKKEFYDNGTCRLVNTSLWQWDNGWDAHWDENKQCVKADGDNFNWKKKRCDEDSDYICEYPGESCYFQTHNSITLASLPVVNATMTLCQSTCRQMIGCFATAPSGDVTSPPFTRCLFIVVAEDTNPMASLTCPAQYIRDDNANARADFPSPPGGGTDPGANPHDCVPPNGTTSNSANGTGQKPLADFLEEARNQTAADCSQITIQPTTVLKTIYVTPTPDLHTVYVSLTPDVITEYVTATPEVVTSYVTVTPQIRTISVTPPPLVHTVTLSPEIQTAYVTVSGPVSTAYVTATTTAEVVVTATVCSSSPSPTHTVSVCPNTTTTTPNSANTNKTKKEVLKEMSSVVKELTVNPAQVSKTRRTKESSPDQRPSAKAIGFVAVMLLMLPPLLILLLDLPAFCKAVCFQHRPPKAGNAANSGKASP